MKFGENIKFYYGTSTYYNITTSISPIQKLSEQELESNKRLKTSKIKVTTDPDTALYYAEKASSDVGGKSVVFRVVPDRFTLIKISKNCYYTSSAKVINAINDSDILYEYFISKIPKTNTYDSDYLGELFIKFLSYINDSTTRVDAMKMILRDEFSNDDT